MPTVNEGWEERFAHSRNVKNFVVKVDHKIKRLAPKMDLVRDFALRMAYGMLKGTLKYQEDALPVSEWVAYEDDDSVDSVNYRVLRVDAMRKAGMLSQ